MWSSVQLNAAANAHRKTETTNKPNRGLSMSSPKVANVQARVSQLPTFVTNLKSSIITTAPDPAPSVPAWNTLPAVGATQTGRMSWYGGDGDGFDGGQTASGVTFNANQATIASFLPAGSVVKITNNGNQKQYLAVVTDTGGFTAPEYNSRIADASLKVAQALDYREAGEADVSIEVLKEGGGQYFSGERRRQLETLIQELTDAQDKGTGISEVVQKLIAFNTKKA
jgi:rare lipoprotein A (peptidoglycan hydrolase)